MYPERLVEVVLSNQELKKKKEGCSFIIRKSDIIQH